MADSIKLFIRLLVVLLIPATIAYAAYVYLEDVLFSAANPAQKEVQLVEVAPKLDFQTLCKRLEQKGLVKDWRALYFVSLVKGKASSLKAGEYELSAAMTPLEVLNKLASGESLRRKVEVPVGSSVIDVGPRIEEAGLLSSEKFEHAAFSKKLTHEAGIQANSFEGYLFPAVYSFARPITAKNIIWEMMVEGEKHWPEEYTTRAYELSMTRHDILTLASIIEKETFNEGTKKLVSSVLHNRLKQGLRLQARSTVIYVIPDYRGELTDSDLQMDSPYNTFMHFGLPPGPICNPGKSSINAALYPADTQFLYFAQAEGGQLVFATSDEELRTELKNAGGVRGDSVSAAGN